MRRGDDYDYEFEGPAPTDISGVTGPIPEPGGVLEGPYYIPPGGRSPYGTGFPSAGLVAAVLGIPALTSLLPERVTNVISRAERVTEEVLRPITEGIITGREATTTEPEATSRASSVAVQPPSAIYYQLPGPPLAPVTSGWASPALLSAAPLRRKSARSSRPSRRKSRLSRKQRAALSAAVLLQLQQ